MALGILLIMGVLALTALIAWVLAIRLSYRIERIRKPDLPRPRLMMTNMFATAFWTGDAKPEELPLQKKLRQLLGLSVGIGDPVTGRLLHYCRPLERPEPRHDRLVRGVPKRSRHRGEQVSHGPLRS